MPGQPNGVAAFEIISIAAADAAIVGAIQLRNDRKALKVSTRSFAMRVVGAHSGPVFLIVGGISLSAQAGGGLYFVVPALLAVIVAAIIGAWVMLVEIVR